VPNERDIPCKENIVMKDQVNVPDEFGDFVIGSDLLHGWLELLDRYEKLELLQRRQDPEAEPDVAYWYGECALTGILAAAAWKPDDGWSLVEYDAKARRSSGKTCACGDLWIGRGACATTVEAKVWWFDGKIATAQKRIEDQLDAARVQLHALKRKYRAGEPVSICYAVPYYKLPEGKTRGESAMAELACWAQSKGTATAMHLEKTKNAQTKRRAYPGVLLVARRESWSKETACPAVELSNG
jgi:hypothetical protein